MQEHSDDHEWAVALASKVGAEPRGTQRLSSSPLVGQYGRAPLRPDRARLSPRSLTRRATPCPVVRA
jgi:hypothetical protein